MKAVTAPTSSGHINRITHAHSSVWVWIRVLAIEVDDVMLEFSHFFSNAISTDDGLPTFDSRSSE